MKKMSVRMCDLENMRARLYVGPNEVMQVELEFYVLLELDRSITQNGLFVFRRI